MGSVLLRIVFVSVLLLTGCNRVFFQPSTQTFAPPPQQLAPWEDHWIIQSEDTVHMRWFHADTASGPAKGVLLHFHGNAENLGTHYLHYLWITREGYDYCIWDYPGYGASPGIPSRESAVRTGHMVLDWVLDSIPSAKHQLVVAGQSLGGALAMSTVATWNKRQHVNAMQLDATFANYRREAQSVLQQHWFTWPLQPLAWILVNNHLAPQELMDSLAGIPKLVTHCTDDRIVPFRFATELEQSLPPPVLLKSSDSCGHTGYLHTRGTPGREFLLDYLSKLDGQS